jgi:hypothetical protein
VRRAQLPSWRISSPYDTFWHPDTCRHVILGVRRQQLGRGHREPARQHRHDPGDERRAYDAVANLWSGYGYQDAPTEVIKMLVNAIEIGYMPALNDVRDGDLDDEIRMWRPDLAEQE